MSRRRCRRGPGQAPDERGAFMVLYALLVVAMFTMAAIVVDLSALREDKRRSRSVADAAATAGAARLTSSIGGPIVACTEAWAYAASNFDVSPPPASPCAGVFSSTCSATTPLTATGTIDGRTVSITVPVTDTSPLLKASVSGGGVTQAASGIDGTPCSRIAVQISHTRDTFFGGVVGINQQTTQTHSVALGTTSAQGGENVPVLVVLEDTDCGALDAGSATIEAIGMNGNPGIIRVDSTGTTGSCGATIEVQGSGKIIAQPGSNGAPGLINYFAQDPRGYTASATIGPFGNFNVKPVQVTKTLTRERWDQEFHCGSSVRGCVASPSNPSATDFIRTLETSYGGSGTPAGFKVYPTDPLVAVQGATCNPTNTVVVPAGNWFVDCASTMDIRGNLTFLGGGTLVFRSGFDLKGTLSINPTGDEAGLDTTVYIRSGNMAKASAGANLYLERTFVYLTNGVLDAQSGGVIHWSSPLAGGFNKLLLWSESTAQHSMQGGPNMDIKGIFFMPNATMALAGNAGTAAQDVQFVVNKGRTQGAAVLRLRGNPLFGLGIEKSISRLIR